MIYWLIKNVCVKFKNQFIKHLNVFIIVEYYVEFTTFTIHLKRGVVRIDAKPTD